MATDASALLGSPQIAGVKVAAVGVARGAARASGGTAGGLIGRSLSSPVRRFAFEFSERR